MDNKRLELQDIVMDEIEKIVEEAPTSDLGESGILVDGKGEDTNASN